MNLRCPQLLIRHTSVGMGLIAPLVWVLALMDRIAGRSMLACMLEWAKALKSSPVDCARVYEMVIRIYGI